MKKYHIFIENDEEVYTPLRFAGGISRQADAIAAASAYRKECCDGIKGSTVNVLSRSTINVLSRRNGKIIYRRFVK